MKHSAITRHLSIWTLAGLLATGGCSGGSDPTTADNPTTDDTESSQPVADEPPASAATETTDSAPSTAATTTTTTEPPPVVASLTASVLPAAAIATRDFAGPVAVLADGTPRAVIAGSAREAAGQPFVATAYIYERGKQLVKTALPTGDAVESDAVAVSIGATAISTTITMVGLVTAADGIVHAAIWQSTDRGDTWTGPDTPFGPGTFAADVAAVDDSLSVILRVDTADGYDLVAASNATGEWVTNPLPTGGDDVVLSGLIVTPGLIVVTGRADRGDRLVGQIWTSTDGGVTYDLQESEAIDATTGVGRPTATEGGFVAAASQPVPLPPVLLRSADGIGWSPSELPLENPIGQPVTTLDGHPTPMATLNGLLVFGYDDVQANVVVIGADGRGRTAATHKIDNDLFWSSRPFVMDGAVYSLANSYSSFAISRGSADLLDWVPAAQPTAETGLVANSVDFSTIAEGPIARSVTYPDVESTEGGFRWTTQRQWTMADQDAWIADTSDLGATVDQVIVNGQRQVAFGALPIDAQDDNSVSGPKGGTSAALREGDAPWGLTVPVLQGPGGDSVNDGAPLGDGFVAVGTRKFTDRAGVDTSSTVILETNDGQRWNEIDTGLDLGDRSSLAGVASLPDGTVVALGTVERDGVTRPLALGRAADGVWSQLDVPITNDDAAIVDVTAVDEGITLLLRDGETWSRVVTTDGRSTTVLPLIFDGDKQPRVEHAVVVSDRSLLVGETTTVGWVYELAVWEVTDDGQAQRIDVADAPFGTSFDVDDVLAVDGRVLVGGTDRGQNIVWTLDLG